LNARTGEQIEKDVVDQLAWDDRLDASAVTVEVVRGTVVLKGSVRSHFARKVAGIDAQAVAGVRQVDNQLRLRQPRPASAGEILIRRARTVLARSAEVDVSELRVSQAGEVLVLEGTARTLWQKDRAGQLVSQLEGVIALDNRIAVLPESRPEDQAIARGVIQALERQGAVSPGAVEVEVREGQVTLRGPVPTWFARHAALRAAQLADGVTEVVDELSIEETF